MVEANALRTMLRTILDNWTPTSGRDAPGVSLASASPRKNDVGSLKGPNSTVPTRTDQLQAFFSPHSGSCCSPPLPMQNQRSRSPQHPGPVHMTSPGSCTRTPAMNFKGCDYRHQSPPQSVREPRQRSPIPGHVHELSQTAPARSRSAQHMQMQSPPAFAQEVPVSVESLGYSPQCGIGVPLLESNNNKARGRCPPRVGQGSPREALRMTSPLRHGTVPSLGPAYDAVGHVAPQVSNCQIQGPTYAFHHAHCLSTTLP